MEGMQALESISLVEPIQDFLSTYSGHVTTLVPIILGATVVIAGAPKLIGLVKKFVGRIN